MSEFFGSKNYIIFLQNLDLVKGNNAFAHIKGCPKFLDHILCLKTRHIMVYHTYQPACLFNRPGRPVRDYSDGIALMPM